MSSFTKEEYERIHQWIRINKRLLRNLYQLFLQVFNDKYHLELYDSKQLYHDLCIYFYHTLRDDYHQVILNPEEEDKRSNEYRIKRDFDLIYSEEEVIEEYLDSSNKEEAEAEEEVEEEFQTNVNFENSELYQTFLENENSPLLYHFSPKPRLS
jgi:hypothetical protein